VEPSLLRAERLTGGRNPERTEHNGEESPDLGFQSIASPRRATRRYDDSQNRLHPYVIEPNQEFVRLGIGKEQTVRVRRSEGLAIHIDPQAVRRHP
jgi:hypothetical protein